MNTEDWDSSEELEEVDPVIDKNNKLMAEFIGLRLIQNEHLKTDLFDTAEYLTLNSKATLTCCVPFQDSLYFHKDWNSLMDVVSRVESIHHKTCGRFGVYICSNSCTIQGNNFASDLGFIDNGYFDEVVLDTKLESTYQACLRFILWLNKQNKDGFTFIQNGISS